MSRRAIMAIAIALACLLVVFVVLSVVTSNAQWILWSAVPLLLALGFVLSAIRGETLGEGKRQRDVVMAERKAAERKAKIAARAAGK
ncbi:hypothetical protein [Blastococcus sp. Marseille-P5729]|uniref:hypothetical protein n=1 Tax=Blastococcus sp. Marseille-P5729 TaxID=2086582 RepID=UPI000D0F58E9|nr:hypothetical protein [Blastococcus sp. Marseille-P5729]